MIRLSRRNWTVGSLSSCRPMMSVRAPFDMDAVEGSSGCASGINRYFSGKLNGEGEQDYSEIDVVNEKSRTKVPGMIDRNKFTHEVKVRMPDVGEDAGGIIETWYKKEGDIIKQDDVICDVRTEMFTFGMITDDDFDSIMGKILVPERTKPIKPGTVICTTFNAEGNSEDDNKKDDE